MISFNSIPVGMRTPGQFVEFDASRATNGQPLDNRILLVGQMLAVGTADALEIVPVAEADQAVKLFGRGSMLARMAWALKKADRYTECHAIGLDDLGGGTAASGTITVTGPATAGGNLDLLIGGQPVTVAVASGTSANDVATAINAAVNAADDLPVSSTVNAAVVTLTALHKGTCGNEIDVRHSHYVGQGLPAGIGLAIVALANGAGDPDYSTIWDKVGDETYRTIIVGTASATILNAMEAELDDRFGPVRALENMCYAAKSGTQGSLATLGAARNSELVTLMGSGKSPNPPWEWAASYGGIVGKASFIDPARPFQTLELPGMVAPRAEQRFTRAERELLLKDGIATFTADAAGTVRIERAITTWQLNASGLPDTAYLDVNTVLTLSYLRAAVRTRIATKYPRHKLADDDTRYGAGQAVVTPKILRAELIALMREMEERGLVERLDQFVADLIVERDADDPNRVNALVPPNIVNQFRQFAAQVQFRL